MSFLLQYLFHSLKLKSLLKRFSCEYLYLGLAELQIFSNYADFLNNPYLLNFLLELVSGRERITRMLLARLTIHTFIY